MAVNFKLRCIFLVRPKTPRVICKTNSNTAAADSTGAEANLTAIRGYCEPRQTPDRVVPHPRSDGPELANSGTAAQLSLKPSYAPDGSMLRSIGLVVIWG